RSKDRSMGIPREVWAQQAQNLFARSAEADWDTWTGRLVIVAGCAFARIGYAGHLGDDISAGIHDRSAARAGSKLGGDGEQEDWARVCCLGMSCFILLQVGAAAYASDESLGEHEVITAGMTKAVDRFARPGTGAKRQWFEAGGADMQQASVGVRIGRQN